MGGAIRVGGALGASRDGAFAAFEGFVRRAVLVVVLFWFDVVVRIVLLINGGRGPTLPGAMASAKS